MCCVLPRVSAKNKTVRAWPKANNILWRWSGLLQNPSDSCCNGLRSLQANTPTVEDRRKAYQCFKDQVASLLPGSDAAARALPGKCGIRVDIPVSGDFDCSTIN
ncbi:hypothetical protein MLD38_023798 [Melastoma candidum]|uniref:Uncharacterized protein n=1 Tax=Melastoma candidum TaxID=119954 RepID=A0ACB9NQF5_9MYRT|nr:hypothetical protein MLD38_023798 [Melastoma candidum]